MSNSIDLLHVADAVAREKGIEREEVLAAMELAIQKAGRTKYGNDHDIRAQINRKTGEIQLTRYQEVVETVEDDVCQITLTQARKTHPMIEVGEFVKDPLPPIDFGRVAAQTARQVIVQRVREVERDRQFAEYKDRVGEIVNGLVKRVEFGNVVVELGNSEALLRRNELINREAFRSGERVRAVIMDVRRDNHGPQVLLSRTHPSFLVGLFAQEVPEIYDGVIEIRSAARDPGSRAKIAVFSKDSGLDPVGACVGVRGSRVQSIVNELQGEKIDIVSWSSNIATFVVNALAPAEVVRVVVEEESKRLDVIVADDQLSIAIGRRGQNIRLATQLTGWKIDMASESEDDQRRSRETERFSQGFMGVLDVDDVLARLLVLEGFRTIEEVAYVDISELSAIEGLDEGIAIELQVRARSYLERQEEETLARLVAKGVQQDLMDLEGLSLEMIVALAEKGVLSLDDFADLAGDEVIEILKGHTITVEDANALIMRARAHWFEDKDAAPVQNRDA